MRRSTVLFFCVALTLIISGASYGILQYEILEFQTILKGTGYYSGHTEEAYYVINDYEKWAEVWSKQTHPPPHEVDFSNTTIIAVFMGQFPTGGYAIEIKEIIDTGGSILVKVEKRYPGKGCGVTLSGTEPYHMVKVDKIEKHVIFKTSIKTILCK